MWPLVPENEALLTHTLLVLLVTGQDCEQFFFFLSRSRKSQSQGQGHSDPANWEQSRGTRHGAFVQRHVAAATFLRGRTRRPNLLGTIWEQFRRRFANG